MKTVSLASDFNKTHGILIIISSLLLFFIPLKLSIVVVYFSLSIMMAIYHSHIYHLQKNILITQKQEGKIKNDN